VSKERNRKTTITVCTLAIFIQPLIIFNDRNFLFKPGTFIPSCLHYLLNINDDVFLNIIANPEPGTDALLTLFRDPERKLRIQDPVNIPDPQNWL
jgi:hypothetical protein